MKFSIFWMNQKVFRIFWKFLVFEKILSVLTHFVWQNLLILKFSIFWINQKVLSIFWKNSFFWKNSKCFDPFCMGKKFQFEIFNFLNESEKNKIVLLWRKNMVVVCNNYRFSLLWRKNIVVVYNNHIFPSE